MKSISEFFDRIRGKQAKEMFLLGAVVETMKNKVGIDVAFTDISFSAKTLVLKGLSQSAKSSVYIKKAQIITELGTRSLGREITDIRSI